MMSDLAFEEEEEEEEEGADKLFEDLAFILLLWHYSIIVSLVSVQFYCPLPRNC